MASQENNTELTPEKKPTKEEMILDVSNMLNGYMNKISKDDISEEILLEAIKAYDETIDFFNTIIEDETKVVKSKLDWLNTEKELHDFHRKLCDKTKKIFHLK